MPEGGLPAEVESFIDRYIHSVEQLEILLLLRRRRESWTGESVARELRIDAGSAGRRLEELTAAGFLSAVPDGHTYGATGELDRLVGQLANAYSERRVAVITRIFSRPADTLRSFADAFRFKGGK